MAIERLKANADAIMNNLDAFRPECSLEELGRPEHVADDFEAAGINSKEDVRAVFSGNFYFGCEADDRATMWAFDPRMGVRLRPVFSSDFTHFDVPDFRDVIPEAFEMVEKGFVTEQDFREFTFTNAARLHTRNNPDFFKGTVVEQAVADELGLKAPLPAAQSVKDYGSSNAMVGRFADNASRTARTSPLSLSSILNLKCSFGIKHSRQASGPAKTTTETTPSLRPSTFRSKPSAWSESRMGCSAASIASIIAPPSKNLPCVFLRDYRRGLRQKLCFIGALAKFRGRQFF